MFRIHRPFAPFGTAVLAAALCTDAAGQQFHKKTTDLPEDPSHFTENVDFADIDIDGDWDVAFADGGNDALQQNTLWLNAGPSQLGVFEDVTAARFPATKDQTWDVEFVDFDNDGDPDLHISNATKLAPQGSRWWHNVGLGSGTYVDETASRWVNLGVNDGVTTFSSLQPDLLIDGTFWAGCRDSDFADIDNDGDLDLFHSTYWFSANSDLIPSHIFLNDGAGFFEEYNPSGFQLPSMAIVPSNPALWAEGLHGSHLHSGGHQADITGTTPDIDFGDVDGDLDLDLLFGDWSGVPRLFENRLDEGGAFRQRWDWWIVAPRPNDNRDQELGDIDGDGDLDVFGSGWHALSETIQFNDGTGHYGEITTLPGPQVEDSEGDFVDFDNDGDLDLYLACLVGADRMYRNDGEGVFTFMPTGTILPNVDPISLDVDVADVDNDGDYDIFVAMSNAPNWYLENTTTSNDTTAPYLNLLEQTPDREAGTEPTVVRVQVYDNAPYYATWYADVALEYHVDGGAFTQVPMRSSAGQIFRGEIPGNLSGTVCYRAFATDEHGNTSAPTALLCYESGGPLVYCAPKLSSAGCMNFVATSDLGALPASLANDYAVTCSDVQGFKNGLLFAGISGPATIPFSGGTLCVAPPNKRGPVMNSGGVSPVDCSGTFSTTVNDAIIPFGMDAGSGNTGWYQYWYRDPNNGAGNLGTALSDAVELDFL